MVWVYERTGSLFLVILMHTSLTASTMILQPTVVSENPLIGGIVLAAVTWAIALGVFFTNRNLFVRRPLPERANAGKV
jgi:hypothetical protein